MGCNILFQNIIHGDDPTNPAGASRRMIKSLKLDKYKQSQFSSEDAM